MSIDKRQFVRLGMQLKMAYKVVGSLRQGASTTQDFSPTGVRFLSEHFLKPGTQIEVELRLPDRKESVSFVGEVVWSDTKTDASGQAGKTEIGLRFVEIAQKDQDLLSHYGKLFGPPASE